MTRARRCHAPECAECAAIEHGENWHAGQRIACLLEAVAATVDGDKPRAAGVYAAAVEHEKKRRALEGIRLAAEAEERGRAIARARAWCEDQREVRIPAFTPAGGA